jgi:hypothetical protein
MANTQMSFAEIGTLYNTISNELEGGVTPQNQTSLLNQVATVQTQIQGLVDSGIFNNLIDDVGNPNPGAVVRVQNIADQMNFLKQEISAYGGSAFDTKYINDVVRDVQDIVANDDNLAALAQQGGHAGFQQISFLLTPPAPFADSGAQTTALLQFISDTNSLTERAQGLVGYRSPFSRGPTVNNGHSYVFPKCRCLLDSTRGAVLSPFQQRICLQWRPGNGLA